MRYGFVVVVLSCLLAIITGSPVPRVAASPCPRVPVSSRPLRISIPDPRIIASPRPEYLWYEAENMRGIATDRTWRANTQSFLAKLSQSPSPGWGINGPGVSAEWSQGGESEWNSVAASADETRATIYQNIYVPRAGDYKVWARYADWSGKNERFSIRIVQNEREVLSMNLNRRSSSTLTTKSVCTGAGLLPGMALQ